MGIAHLIVFLLVLAKMTGKFDWHWAFVFIPYYVHQGYWLLIYIAATHYQNKHPDSDIVDYVEKAYKGKNKDI